MMGRGAGEDFKGQEEQGLDPQVQERGGGGSLQVQERGEGEREDKSSDENRVMGAPGENGELQEVVQEKKENEITMDQGKNEATAYKEGYMDTVGRVLLATRPLSVGELVVEDVALLAAPDGAPVCLGCLAMLTQTTPVNCANCGWPLCRLDIFMEGTGSPQCDISRTSGNVSSSKI